jgi:hypothetical protein
MSASSRTGTRSWVRVACFSISCLFVAACGESIADPFPEGAPGDPALGRIAFAQSCATCHSSGDGWDLAFFGFSDRDIRRRAAPHVDAVTANHIVAHVRTLGVDPVAGVIPPRVETVAPVAEAPASSEPELIRKTKPEDEAE